MKLLNVNLEEALTEDPKDPDDDEAPEGDDQETTDESDTSDDDGEGTADENEEDAPLFNAEQQTAFDRAIAKKTARIKGLEERLAKLEATAPEVVDPVGNAQPAPSVDLLASTEAGHKLMESEQQHQAWLNAAADLLERFPDDPDAVVAELKTQHNLNIPEARVEQTLKGMINRFEREIQRLQTRGDVMRETAAQRLAESRQKTHAQALKVYPWLGDRKSSEFQTAAQILAEAPWLKNRPDVSEILGDLVTGRLARERVQAALKKRQADRGVRPVPSSTAPKLQRGGLTGKRGGTPTGKLLENIAAGDSESRVKLLESMLG